MFVLEGLIVQLNYNEIDLVKKNIYFGKNEVINSNLCFLQILIKIDEGSFLRTSMED